MVADPVAESAADGSGACEDGGDHGYVKRGGADGSVELIHEPGGEVAAGMAQPVETVELEHRKHQVAKAVEAVLRRPHKASK